MAKCLELSASAYCNSKGGVERERDLLSRVVRINGAAGSLLTSQTDRAPAVGNYPLARSPQRRILRLLPACLAHACSM